MDRASDAVSGTTRGRCVHSRQQASSTASPGPAPGLRAPRIACVPVAPDIAIRTSALSKDFGQGHGLFDLDLDVERGEMFGFLGPNGAGKSTTMRLLLDLIRPTSGSATRARARHPRREPRDPAPRRLPAGRPRALPEADRRGDPRLPGRAARRRRPARPRRARRALRRAARPAGARAVDGQPPEARAHPGVHARARAADPRRADRRARSARAAELPRAAGRGRGAGPHGLPLVAHAVGGRAGRASRRDPAPRPAGRGRLAREPAERSPSSGSRSSSAGRRRRPRSSARSPASAR